MKRGGFVMQKKEKRSLELLSDVVLIAFAAVS